MASRKHGHTIAVNTSAPTVRIGVISDTHGCLDPLVLQHFAGVAHIIHAGDILDPGILAQLEQLAPVTAVAGNVETEPAGLSVRFIPLRQRAAAVKGRGPRAAVRTASVSRPFVAEVP